MATFAELKKQDAATLQKSGAGRDIIDFPDISAQVDNFLTAHGFTDLEFLTKGNSAIILQDLQNPSLVFRISPIVPVWLISHDIGHRQVVPQMLQPLYVEAIDGRLKIELMRNISSSLSDEDFESLLDKYVQEAKASDYELHSDTLWKDVGVFTYDDPKRPGHKKSVIMRADEGLIPAPPTDHPPTCTADYPTLEIQWQEQCKMVEADPRLKNLLGGLPKKLPVTRVIPSLSQGLHASH